MKLEKISDNQIKCTLNKSDLASREIKLSELAYGTEKAKDLFRDMMQQASYEFGFEAEDIPLMIEAIPVSPDCIVLLITKVDDPEELDTRFSKFAPSSEEDEEEENTISVDPEDTVLGLLNDMTEILQKAKEMGGVDEKEPTTAEYEVPVEPVTRLYIFQNLDDVIHACHYVKGLFKGTSACYKVNDNAYHLLFTSSQSSNEISHVCNIFSEYAKKKKTSSSAYSYYNEHHDCILAEDAIDKLSTL